MFVVAMGAALVIAVLAYLSVGTSVGDEPRSAYPTAHFDAGVPTEPAWPEGGVPEGGRVGSGRTGEPGAADDPYAQDETTESGWDGAVPLPDDVVPPYQSPPGVELTRPELNRRRLEQVGLIDRRIEALREQIRAAPEGGLRGVLEARRAHLEERRTELLESVLEEATTVPPPPTMPNPRPN